MDVFKILMLKFGRNADVWLRFEFWNLIKICVRTCYFGKENLTLGSVLPLAMFSIWNANLWPDLVHFVAIFLRFFYNLCNKYQDTNVIQLLVL